MGVDVGFLIAMVMMFGCGLFAGVTFMAMKRQDDEEERNDRDDKN